MAARRSVLVAMSGGVDSSTTAYLLSESGYDVIGITMRLYEDSRGENDQDSPCCSSEMAEKAAAVCRQIGAPHYVVDFREDFRRNVIDDFVNQYLSGMTPNPCVRCNTYIKWETLVKKKAALGADYIATGHYARVIRDSGTGSFELHRGIDKKKDQSYFLWGLTGEQLGFTLLPLGELTKKEVRKRAKLYGLATAEVPESMEVCFIPDNDYRRFIEERFGKENTNSRPGEFHDTEGNVIGQHNGFHNFTVGQRKKLGISVGKKMFVQAIYPEKNVVVVGDVEDLETESLSAHSVNWINGVPPEGSREAEVMIRYRDPGTPALIEPGRDSTVKVQFKRAVRAATPGQSAVFYRGSRVIGGGIIDRDS